jgi:hypothetical protein
LLIFAPAPSAHYLFFILFIIYLPVLHFTKVLPISNYGLDVIFSLLKKAFYFYDIYFSSTLALFVHALYSHKRTALSIALAKPRAGNKKRLLYKSSILTKLPSPLSSAVNGSRWYSINSSGVSPSFASVKVYINADKDKIRILKENKGKCGIYR